MKRVALARGATPLRRTPLKRGTAAPRAAYEKPGSGRTAAGRAPSTGQLVSSRSRGRCEIGAVGCHGTATDLHRRNTDAPDTAANLLHTCEPCRTLANDHPAIARLAGWTAADPLCEPVRYRCRELRWLLEDGRTVGERGAA